MLAEKTLGESTVGEAKAYAHPCRRLILHALDAGPCSPVVIAGRSEFTLGTVAYHFRTLERLGLVRVVETIQRRGALEHVYGLAAA